MEAASLLVPQLENSLRHILALNGIDTTAMDNEGIQTEASLTILMGRYRKELEEIMGGPIVHEIDMLFTFPGGPSLRNAVAHAKIPANGYWDRNVIWGSWFVLHIAIWFLVKNLKEAEQAMNNVPGLPTGSG